MSRNENKISLLVVVTVLIVMVVGAWRISGLYNQVTLTIGVYSGSYWDTPNGDCYQILDTAISEFEEQHPNVKVNYVSGIGADDYSEWLAEQILLGKEPDLYFVLPEDFTLLASSGALAKLDDMLFEKKEFHREDFYSPCLLAGRYNGVQYALPHESVPSIMFVNKTLLAENGIEFPGSDWTWDDFYRICQKVTDPENHRYGVYNYTWTSALYSNGASLFSDDGKKCFLSDDKVQQAVQFVQKLKALNEGYTVTSKDFDLGYVAFRPFLYSEYRAYQPYPWRVKRYTHFEWDAVTMPAGPKGDNISELHTMLVGLSSRSRHTDLALDFAVLLCSDPDIQQNIYRYSHGISPLKSVTGNKDNELLLRHDIPGGGAFGSELISEIMSTAAVSPRFSKYDQAMNMAEAAVNESQNSSVSIGGLMYSAEREITEFLNKK